LFHGFSTGGLRCCYKFAEVYCFTIGCSSLPAAQALLFLAMSRSGSQIETDTETKSRGPASNRSPCRCYSPRESKPNHPLQGTRRTRIVSRSRRTEDRSGNFKYLWLDSCLLNPRQNQFNKDVTSAVTSSKALILRGFQGAAAPWLGYSFASAGAPKKRIAPKAVDRFKERIRELTSRNRGVRIERMAEELFLYLRGWIGYFGRCETPSVLAGLEQWLRCRLRSAIWKQWKRGPSRFHYYAFGP